MSKINHIYRQVQFNEWTAQEGLNQGQKGEPGAPGLAGVVGIKGLQGDKGERGDIGKTTVIKFALNVVDPKGLPADGVIPAGFEGNGCPEHNIRVDVGDCVVHVSTRDLWCYLPKSNYLGWLCIGKLAEDVIGVPGVKGETGDLGGIGPRGDVGPQGERGTQGTKGTAGVDGTKGDKGDLGQKGSPGYKGERGDEGIKGEEGLNGFDGLDGDKGPKGEAGVDGIDGLKGIRGAQGARGPVGPSPDVMQLGLLPVAAICFDGASLLVNNSYNIGAIKPLSLGRYRLRFSKKLEHDSFVVMAHAAVKSGGESHARLVTVVERSSTFCVIDITNPQTGEKCDANSIDALVYQFPG